MNRPRLLLILIALLTAACSASPTSEPDAIRPGASEPSADGSGPEYSTAPSAPEPEITADTAAHSENANADVIFVRAVLSERGTWTFHVTVRHPDTGWEDYADGWDVVLPDGKVVKPDPTSPFTRLLLHPHEMEQPFTRSQGGITIPDGVDTVTVRAHDLVDGFGGKEIVVDLKQLSGTGFEIERGTE